MKHASRVRGATVLAGLGLATCLTVPAIAQTSTSLTEIVVTARRVEERSLTVPVTVTAFGGDNLSRLQVQSVDDLVARTPSLQMRFDPNRGNDFQMRGVGRTFQGDPGVVTYIAEAPRTIYGDPSLFDLASVQLLKGPQGTLFGRNSTGGAALFTPNRPVDRFEGSITGRVGNYDLREATGVLNLPVSDALSLRLAGRYAVRGGLQKNIGGADLNSRNRNALRLSALYKPTDTFETYTILDAFNRKEYDLSYVLQAVAACPASQIACLYSPPLATALRIPTFAEVLAEQRALGVRTLNVPNPRKSSTHTYAATNHTEVELGGVTLRNIFNYQTTRQSLNRDFDGSRLRIMESFNYDQHRQITEELQIRGLAFDDRLSWVSGVFVSKNQDGSWDLPGSGTSYFVDIPPGLGLPANPRLLTSKLTSKSKAIYGQGTYDLDSLATGLKLTAGLRYTWDSKRFVGTDFTGARTPANCNNIFKTGPNAGQPLSGTNIATCERELKAKFKAPSWTISLEYAVSPDSFVYATTRRGYKSGNFNVSGTGTQFISYEPETLTDVEIGGKTQGHVGDMAYRVNLAAYVGAYKDIQTQQTVFLDQTLQILVLNAGRARVKGFELEATVAPVSGLEISGYFALTDGKYTMFRQDIGGLNVALTGKPLLGVPKRTSGLNVRYTAALGEDLGKLAAAVLVSHQSGSVQDYNSPDEQGSVRPLTTVDATLEWREPFGAPASLMFFVKNLTDKTHLIYAFDGRRSLGVAFPIFNDPRTWGAELTYRF